jgi:AsmA-like C-terminal region
MPLSQTKDQLTSRTGRRIAITLLALIVLIAIGLWIAGRSLSPLVRSRAIAASEKYFDGQVKFATLNIAFTPEPVISGTDLTVSLSGHPSEPALISIKRFSARVGLIGVLRHPIHLSALYLDGLRITIPRGPAAHPERDLSGKKGAPALLIDYAKADGATLIILPKKEGSDPLEFDLHKLTLRGAGGDGEMTFQAALTNAKPPGEIRTTGKFGPWQAEDPRATPVSGKYEFSRADLSVFKGIEGTLSSKGSFQGKLENIDVSGETDTPNFGLKISGNRFDLKTQFQATVDGTDGNTYLHPVSGQFGHSSVEAQGKVEGLPGSGKTVALDATVNSGRLEDMLRLAVSGQPAMTGTVSFHSNLVIPPAKEDIAEKLRMDGTFNAGSALFSNSQAQEKVDDLSKRGEGHPKDPDQTVASNFSGQFHLDGGIIHFQKLGFSVPGVSVQLDGTYGLETSKLDFQGTARLEAKLSQTTTGLKSFLLKAADPFFDKGSSHAVIPIKIGGTPTSPSFGLDLKGAKK